MLTDTLQSCGGGAGVPSGVPAEDVWGDSTLAVSKLARRGTNAERHFPFPPFPIKSSLDVFQLVRTETNVFFRKVWWGNATLES